MSLLTEFGDADIPLDHSTLYGPEYTVRIESVPTAMRRELRMAPSLEEAEKIFGYWATVERFAVPLCQRARLWMEA